MRKLFSFRVPLVFCTLALSAFAAGCKEQSDETPEQQEMPKVTTKRAAPMRVKLQTSMGHIVIELAAEAAPITTENFLGYTREGFYNGTIFHRVIDGFMVQCGGLTADMQKKTTGAPIKNESDNGLKNKRAAVAMARTADPDSATSQFFINLADNPQLDYAPGRPGYAVFGKVIDGMETVDRIAAVATTNRAGRQNVPAEPIIIESATVLTDTDAPAP